MATPEDHTALTTLAFLARTSAQLDAFRNQLKQARQLHASSFVECRYYGDDLYICICLEAEPHENQTLTWWLDITPRDQQWLIEASALWNGRDPVVQFPAQAVPDFQAVQASVPGILEQLLQAGVAVLDKVTTRAAATNQLVSK
jgi:hypothetical protein